MKIRIKHLLVITSTCLVLAGCGESEQVNNNKSAEYLARASSYFDQGQYKVAAIELQNAIKENSNNVEAYYLLAKLYYEVGNHAGSLEILKSLPQDSNKVYLLQAENNLAMGKAKTTLSTLGAARKKNLLVNDLDAYLAEGSAYLLLNETNNAGTAIKKASSLAGSSEKAQSRVETLQAKLYAKLKQSDNAVTALTKAVKLDSGNIEALVLLAEDHYRKAEYEAAEDQLSQALFSLQNTDSMTLKRLQILKAMVSTLSQQGRSAEAMVYSKMIAEANPKAQEIESELNSAIQALNKGDIEKAEKLLSKLYDSSSNEVAGSLLGVVKYSKGEFENASNLFDKFIDPETANAQTLTIYAETALRVKNPEEALKAIESNINDNADNPRLLSIYGLALLSTGQTEKGTEVIKAALKLEPGMSRLRLALADKYNAEKKPELALEQLEAAYQHAPNDHQIEGLLLNQYDRMELKDKRSNFIESLLQKPQPESAILAGLALLNSEPKRGEAAINKALAAAPDNQAVLNAKVILASRLEDHDGTIKYAERILEQDENKLFALSRLASAYTKKEDEKKAIDFLKTYSDEHINAWASEYLLASHFLSTNKISEAKTAIESALLRSSFNSQTSTLAKQIYLAQAYGHIQKNNNAEAKKSVLEAIQLAPQDLELQHYLLGIELREGNIKQAEKLADEIYTSAPESAISHLVKGDIAKHSGKPEQALLHYLDAWKAAPSDKTAKVVWANISKDSSLTHKQFLSQWTTTLPGSFEAITMDAIMAQQAGKSELAIKHYKKSLLINPRQPIALNNLAWLYFDQNKLPEAKAIAYNAFTLAPENPAILDTYGWILFKSGDRENAKSLLSKAAKIAPNNTDIASHLKEASVTQ